MNKQELLYKLKADHQSFVDYILQLSDNEFLLAVPGKWTAGQQLEHIFKSVKPVAMAFGLPDFVLKLAFGKANRPSRSYPELVSKYKAKLAAGYTVSKRFTPDPVGISDRLSLSKSLILKVGQLSFIAEKCSDEQLDMMLLPHPLLGKLTLREMLYFSVYHVEHHLLLTKKNFSEAKHNV